MLNIFEEKIPRTLSYTERMCLSVIKRYTPEVAYYDYVNGLGLECLYRAGIALGREDWKEFVRDRFDLFINDDGRVKTFDIEEYSMDQISPGKVFFGLYDETNNPKYKKALDLFFEMLMKQPRTPSGGFWHKQIYPNQMWLDGLYMQGSFYIQYAKRYGDLIKCLDDVVYQYELIYDKALDKKTGLLFHAWDESKKMAWADSETGLSKSIWCRAMGWYAMGLVDALDHIPEEDAYLSYRERLIKLANSIVLPILNVQDEETGLWYQVLDKGKIGQNYLESSSSSMFVYFLKKMVRKGYIDTALTDKALEGAAKGFNGLTTYKIAYEGDGEIHLIDICRGAGLGKYYLECPFRDGTFAYYTEREPKVWDNLQGVGPFILACLEMEHEGTLN